MPGLGLDNPPPLPGSTVAQMGGGNPFQGMGGLISGAGKPAGGPQGDLKATFDTVKKVLQEKMAGMSAGKDLVSQAMKLLDQALMMESQKGPGTPVAPQADLDSPESGSKEPPAPFAG